MKVILAHILNKRKIFQNNRLFNILCKFFMVFKFLSKIKLCIEILNFQMYLNMMVLLKLLILDSLNSSNKKMIMRKLFLDHLLIWLPKFLIIKHTIIKLIFGQLVWHFINWFFQSNSFCYFRVPYTASNIIDLLKKIKN